MYQYFSYLCFELVVHSDTERTWRKLQVTSFEGHFSYQHIMLDFFLVIFFQSYQFFSCLFFSFPLTLLAKSIEVVTGWTATENRINASSLQLSLSLFFPFLAGWLDRDQMEEVCVAGSNLCTHPLPCDGGRPHPMQLQPVPEGRCAKCVAAQPAAGSEGALALLVGGRPKLCWSHPPWACRWGLLCIHIRTCNVEKKVIRVSSNWGCAFSFYCFFATLGSEVSYRTTPRVDSLIVSYRSPCRFDFRDGSHSFRACNLVYWCMIVKRELHITSKSVYRVFESVTAYVKSLLWLQRELQEVW